MPADVGWFSRRLVPPPDAAWILEVYRWLLEHLGGWEVFGETPLVLPTPDQFPIPPGIEGEELAEHVLHLTQEHAGMGGMIFDLEVEEQAPSSREVASSDVSLPYEPDGVDDEDDEVDVDTYEPLEPLEPQDSQGAWLPTLGPVASKDEDEMPDGRDVPVLRYRAETLARPPELVADLSYQLAFYLAREIESSPPGGEEVFHDAIDVAQAFLGFGVFAANSAFTLEAYQEAFVHGWRAVRRGRLNERMHAYALAVFLEARRIDERVALPHLRMSPRSALKRALRELRSSERLLQGLRAVKTRPGAASHLRRLRGRISNR